MFTGGDTASFAAIDDVVVDEQPCSAHGKSVNPDGGPSFDIQ